MSFIIELYISGLHKPCTEPLFELRIVKKTGKICQMFHTGLLRKSEAAEGGALCQPRFPLNFRTPAAHVGFRSGVLSLIRAVQLPVSIVDLL